VDCPRTQDNGPHIWSAHACLCDLSPSRAMSTAEAMMAVFADRCSRGHDPVVLPVVNDTPGIADVRLLHPNVQCSDASVLLGAALKNSVSFMSRPRKAMSEWVLHCEVNQRHIRRIQPTREAALKDACSQLLQGHAVNRIVGPNKTITAERVRDWCAKHRS